MANPSTPGFAQFGGSLGTVPVDETLPLTKWYEVHKRHTLSEFRAEGFVLAIGLVILVAHVLGARANRAKARAWIRAHAPVLTSQFALVGFSGVPNTAQDGEVKPDGLLKEKSLFEFATYATGRQNVAFADVKMTLTKRFNPVITLVETVASFLWESAFEAPADTVEVLVYPFDGKEAQTVPSIPGAAEASKSKGGPSSSYDSFVWALVNKSGMQQLRESRYDLSLTSTKDHPSLPEWLTVMGESAEITTTMLTPELIAAVTAAGPDTFDHLIVTDQPDAKPKTLSEASPSKRVLLRYRVPADNDYAALVPLTDYALRLPDLLVRAAHFRPEVLRKVRATRDAMSRELRKAAEEEKNEERLLEREKAKKAKRDAELAALDAKAQKKYLDREREKELRKSQKKQTMRG